MRIREELVRIFPKRIGRLFESGTLDIEKIQEIRMRINRPLLILYAGKERFITDKGILSKEKKDTYSVTDREIAETLEYISNYSLYAFEEEIRQGFLTIQGGHRIGIAGRVIVEGGKIRSLKHIFYLNIRMAHEVKGCADAVMPYIVSDKEVFHTLIISPPGCGKTTLLRDCIRQISNGEGMERGYRVGVVDERSELGGSYLGIPQSDLGIRTDLLDCCPKAEGIIMLLRSMSPQVIAVDEIGAKEDIPALETAIYGGCKLLATVHGNSLEELKKKPMLARIFQEELFERYVVLGKEGRAGRVKSVMDTTGTVLHVF